MKLKRREKLLRALETLKTDITSSNKTYNDLMTSITNLIIELNYIIYDYNLTNDEYVEQTWLRDNK